MYSALILLCLSNEPVGIDNCMIMQSNVVYESESDCTEAIIELLNFEMFKYSYSDYRLENLVCYEWLDPSESKA